MFTNHPLVEFSLPFIGGVMTDIQFLVLADGTCTDSQPHQAVGACVGGQPYQAVGACVGGKPYQPLRAMFPAMFARPVLHRSVAQH